MTDSVNVPSGLPMAMTCWPTLSAEASPIGIVGSDVVGSTLTTARSCVAVGRDDGPRQLGPVLERDGDLVAALDDVVVREDETEASKTKPDPTPVDGTENGPNPAWPAESDGDRHDGRAGRLGDGDDRVRGRDGPWSGVAWRSRSRALCRSPCPWHRGR